MRRSPFLHFTWSVLAYAVMGCEPPSGSPNVLETSRVETVLDLGTTGGDRGWLSEPSHVYDPELSGSAPLYEVRDVAIGSEGQIFLTNGGSEEVVILDPRWQAQARLGGKGDGPGEFGRVSWLEQPASGGILAGDHALRRLTWFEPSSTSESGWIPRTESPPEGGIPPVPIAVLADGTRIGILREAPESRAGSRRPAVQVFAWESAGREPASLIGTWDGDEVSIFRQDGFLQVVEAPFARRSIIRTTPTRVWIGDSGTGIIQAVDSAGGIRQVFILEGGQSAVNNDLVDWYLSERYQSEPDEEVAARLSRDVRELVEHSKTPAFADFLVSTSGTLWVRAYLPVDGAAEWTHWDVDGQLGTRLRVPSEFRPFRFGENWVVGVWTDSIGRETVRRYELPH